MVGISTSQEGSTWENIFSPTRSGGVIYPKGLREENCHVALSHSSTPSVPSSLWIGHLHILCHAMCPDPVGKPVVVQLFLGPKWDSLEGKY